MMCTEERGILVHYDDYDDHNSGKFKVYEDRTMA